MKDQLMAKAFEDYRNNLISSEELDKIKDMINKLDLDTVKSAKPKKPTYIKYRGKTIIKERIKVEDRDTKPDQVMYRGSKYVESKKECGYEKRKTVIYRGVKL